MEHIPCDRRFKQWNVTRIAPDRLSIITSERVLTDLQGEELE